MVRLVAFALILLSLPDAAWSSPPTDARTSKQPDSYQLPRSANDRRFAPRTPGRAEIAPNTHFGFGIYGLKPERSYLQPTTGREINAPKQRRAAVGFSLKF